MELSFDELPPFLNLPSKSRFCSNNIQSLGQIAGIIVSMRFVVDDSATTWPVLDRIEAFDDQLRYGLDRGAVDMASLVKMLIRFREFLTALFHAGANRANTITGRTVNDSGG